MYIDSSKCETMEELKEEIRRSEAIDAFLKVAFKEMEKVFSNKNKK
jgi:hypothetical protein